MSSGKFLNLNFQIGTLAPVVSCSPIWHKKKFGFDIAPYGSSESAIDTWPAHAFSMGLRLSKNLEFQMYTPFGLDDAIKMTVRPNKVQVTKEIYEAKANRWKASWPSIEVIPWN
jgi:uncharacterized protein